MLLTDDQFQDFATPNPAPPFYRPSAPANFARPGKRPLSACSPTIVTVNRESLQATAMKDQAEAQLLVSPPLLALGGAGGSRIITLVATLLLTLLPPYMPHPEMNESRPLTIQEALALPRIHDSLTPNQTSLEYGEPGLGLIGYSNVTAAFLHDRGHNLAWVEPHYSAAQAIAWECDTFTTKHVCGFTAASDPRHIVGGARVR